MSQLRLRMSASAGLSWNIRWMIKDNHIGSVFFDESASAFIHPILLSHFGIKLDNEQKEVQITPAVAAAVGDGDIIYKSSSDPSLWNSGLHTVLSPGAAVGPGWLYDFNFIQSAPSFSFTSSTSTSSATIIANSSSSCIINNNIHQLHV